MRLARNILIVLAAVVIGILAYNSSWFAAPNPDAKLRLIAHRGMHQTFSRDNLTNETCTAERIFPPPHPYLENTLASAQAAFDAGADIVEIDIAPTSDGKLALFHDWTVDCRTEASGNTRDFTLAQLQALDIGFGYTADAGKTYPFRGKGTGLMPTLGDMLDKTEGGTFLVNFKSKDASEADMLAAEISAQPDRRLRVWSAYGGQPPSDRINELIPGLQAFGTKRTMKCLVDYLATGWTGIVPDTCRDTKVAVPANFAFLLWGWPDRFAKRMRMAGSEIILFGPATLGATGSTGIDSIEDLSYIPAHFDGYVWTNRIELIGPALAAR